MFYICLFFSLYIRITLAGLRMDDPASISAVELEKLTQIFVYSFLVFYKRRCRKLRNVCSIFDPYYF